MFSTASALVKSATKFASPPAIYQEINRVIGAADSTVNAIAEVVARDPGVSIRVLRVVNSAYYGLPTKIDTISEAVATIGTRQLRDLVLATTVMKQFEGIPEDLIDVNAFWRHSLATGIAARTLAAARKESNLESFFVGGMLHDLGRLVLFARMPNECIQILKYCRSQKQLMLPAEREIFGYDHTDVGQELFRAWNLPGSLEEVAGCHHVPQKATSSVLLVSIVHLADILVHALNLGDSGEPFVPEFSPFAWAQYGRPPAVLGSIYNDIERQYRDFLENLNNGRGTPNPERPTG